MLTACSDNDKVAKSGGVSPERLQIVSSIKPIQAIVLAIAGEQADVAQLIPDYASPHDYSFKPSDIRKVENADIVFRIDEHMETQLNGVFDNLKSDKTTIISLAHTDGLRLLEKNQNHQKSKHHDHNQEHSHENEKGHSHADHSDHNKVDFHIWTSPKNTVLMAKQVASSLSKLDAKNAEQYQQNLEEFFDRVKAMSIKISNTIGPYQNKPYIVFHNSWQYFATEFGLQNPIVIDLHEGVSSGAKTISDVHQRIDKEKIHCVFYDSGISLARLKIIAEKAKIVEIDVLAKDISLGQSTYINWLEQFANQIESCLSN